MTCDGEPMTSSREYSDVEYVFEPQAVSTPHLRTYLESLWSRRAFMVALASADIRSVRSNKALGNLWSLFDPMFQATVYFFLYNVLRAGSANLGFLPVLIADIFLFSLTTQALNDGGSSIKRSKSLVLSSTFPRALLPLTSIYRSLRQFIPIACVYAVLFPLIGGKFGGGLLVLPLLFVTQTVINLGLSLIVATLVVLYKDASNLVSYVQRVLFFATPLIYPFAILPATAKAFVSWQPLFALFASYQAVFAGEIPNAWLVIQAMVWAAVLLFFGGRMFLRHEQEFGAHL